MRDGDYEETIPRGILGDVARSRLNGCPGYFESRKHKSISLGPPPTKRANARRSTAADNAIDAHATGIKAD